MKAIAVCFLLALTSVEALDKETPVCQLCEMVVGKLNLGLNNTVDVEQWKIIVEEICESVHSPEGAKCMADMKAGAFDQFVAKLKLFFGNPAVACEKASICTEGVRGQFLPSGHEIKRKLVKQVLAMSMVSATPECILCEYVMTEVEHLLTEKATEQDIEIALSKVCGLTPKTVRSDCDSFVTMWTPKIVQAIVTMVTPAMVCSSVLNMCT